MPINLIQNIIHFINNLNEWMGRLVAWLILIISLLIVYQTSASALFSINSIALQELQWHLFALIFLFGAGYTLKNNEHVRVDIIYQSHWFDDRHRAWINLLGGVFLLIPFCILVIYSSLTFVAASVKYSLTLLNNFPFIEIKLLYAESSADPGGLPYRFLLKAAIPIGFTLLMLQGIAESLKNFLFLLNNQEDKAC
ncbi:MAG: TRAP transporter small permease subunit [Thiomargarita sp.]|nr:TRAP transporter small permease subunit [Thiomargarita sp.]